MINLSFSTLNMLYTSSHNWINRQAGATAPDQVYFQKGREIHRIIQDHVSGKRTDKRLDHLKYSFPLVEEKDRDKRCKFTIPIDSKFQVIGYIDGQDPENKRFLEIKTAGSKFWTVGEFYRSMQRKIYALAKPEYEEAVLITCLSDFSTWEFQRPREIVCPLTQKDRDEAMEWILGGIKIIQSGDFSGGLNEYGVCEDRRCYYDYNCTFKQ